MLIVTFSSTNQCSSSRVFRKLQQRCTADDVVIHGRDKEEHDKHLKAFMARCRELGVKLNAEKMETALDTVTFMGHRISKSGLGIDPEKVSAITSMKEPENVGELRRFNGMINYIAKFVPNLATAMQPLHNLLKKNTKHDSSH